MPTFRLKNPGSAPWKEWQEWIEAKPDKNKFFKREQGRLQAFVIAWWENESLWSTKYLADYDMLYGPESNLVDQGQNADWQSFGDDMVQENPKEYLRLSRALEVIAELRRIFQTERIGLVLWQHPEADYKPVEDYILMSGDQLPGSPRQ